MSYFQITNLDQTAHSFFVMARAIKYSTCTISSLAPYTVSLHARELNKHICSASKSGLLTFWRRNYFFLILAHPVYKM